MLPLEIAVHSALGCFLLRWPTAWQSPQAACCPLATGTNYLCTLYKNDAEDGYLYLGVQISGTRLAEFSDGQLDLRDAYVYPEADCCLCLVAATNGVLNIVKPLQIRDITEEMLLEAGYTYSMVQ